MAAADGSVVVKIDADAKQAQQELNRLTRKIDALKEKISRATAERMPLLEEARELGARLDQAKENLYEMKNAAQGKYTAEQIAEQKELVKTLQAQWDAVTRKVESYDAQISRATSELEYNEAKAGQAAARLAEMNQAAEIAEQRANEQRMAAAAAAAAEADKAAHKITLMGDSAAEAGHRGASGLKKLERRIIGLAKRVFIFSLITKALRNMRAALGNIIKKNDDAAAAIANLKTALKNLVTPLLQAVIPALTVFLNTLTYIIRAITSLFGGSADATNALGDEADALDDVSDAAAGATKSMAGFDEINQLGTSGGGKAAAKTYEFDPGSLPDKLKAAIDEFFVSFKDVIFDWSDLTPEQIVEKAIAGLGAFIGAGLGFMIGGVPGAITGAMIGVLASIVFSSVIFDHDGIISKGELTKLIMVGVGGLLGGAIGLFATHSVQGALIGFAIGAALSLVLSSITVDKSGNINGNTVKSLILAGIFGLLGGILGFTIGGPLGALIGFTLGFGLSLVLGSVVAKEAEEAYLATELGRQLRAMVEEATQRAQNAVDLVVHINSITGEVDSKTMADFTLAKQLIDEIFYLNDKPNKTTEEMEVLKGKIEMLNGLNIDAFKGIFDAATGEIKLTRDEVQLLIEDILKSYEIEAMGNAYVQMWEAQYKAVAELESATDAYKESVEKATQAQKDYDDLVAQLDSGAFAGNWWEMGEAISNAEQALKDAKEAVEKNRAAMGELATGLDTSSTKLANFQLKLKEMRTGVKDSSTAAVKDAKQSIVDGTPGLKEAMENAIRAAGMGAAAEAEIDYPLLGQLMMTELAQGIGDYQQQAADAIDSVSKLMKQIFEADNKIASPSGLYAEEGDLLMQGLAQGVTDNGWRPVNAIKAVLNNMISVAERGINAIVAQFNSVASAASAVGGTPVPSLRTVSIPRLAQGAIIPPNREFLAVLGDQKSGTNIEAPLETIVAAMRQALGSGGMRQPIVLEVGGHEFGKIVVDLYNQESQRIGTKIGGIA